MKSYRKIVSLIILVTLSIVIIAFLLMMFYPQLFMIAWFDD